MNSLDVTNDIVFSLDIGTRTVIGIVGKYEDGILNILASDVLSHEKRAMYDGQIHDINSVVRVAKRVKENLEAKLGFDLEKVAVAAAGRSLEISRAQVTVEVDTAGEIDKSTIRSAELEAIQKAEKLLKEKENIKDKKYYCVGHTVVNYFLDDVLIENLEGHKGEKIALDLIATFLPHTVVDSLGTVMERLNLEIIKMTLEPIAAINVAVKKNLRLLNIALVDIGAGTSDIAITKDGTVSAYAMVPLAGDEITEKLVKTYLLDYDIAEKLKIQLNVCEDHEFQDIIGTTYKLNKEEILDKIDDSIKKLAEEISNKILDLNEGPPSVVFLIGGGSQIPRLGKYISEKLDTPEERVAVKDTSLIENVKGITENISGPEAITPLGIALMAIESNYKDFIEVTLNGEEVRIFNTEKPKVTDALLLTGFNPRNLVSKRGQALKYYLNNEEKSALGQLGEPAKVYLNDELSHLEHRLKDKDVIQIEDATVGERPNTKVFDVIKPNKIVYLDNDPYELILNIYVNDTEIKENIKLNDDDKIEVIEIKTVKELLDHLDLDTNNLKVIKDEEEIPGSFILTKGDMLKTKIKEDFKVQVEDQQEQAIEVFKKPVENIDPLKKTIELSINDEKKYIDYTKDEFQFVDVFDHIDFNLTEAKGNLVLKVNGLDAEYLQKLNNKDILKIYWDN